MKVEKISLDVNSIPRPGKGTIEKSVFDKVLDKEIKDKSDKMCKLKCRACSLPPDFKCKNLICVK